MNFGQTNLRRLSPIARLGPFLVGKHSPTASLYFENACGDWLKEGRVQKIAPTVFASDTAQIIFRHDVGVPVGFSRKNTIYFMDDYWWVDGDMPWQYRAKFKLVEQRAARYFLKNADHIGLSSDTLIQAMVQEFSDANPHLMQPYWSEPLADLDHFDNLGLEICFLGARSHANDLALIIPAIRAVLNQFPAARFTLSAQHRLPIDLNHHPRINRIPEMGWQPYRHEITRHRFHIALYPLRANYFNKSRSVNKLIEHAVVGAATICSSGWQSPSDRLISVTGGAADWVRKLCEIADQKELLRKVAQANKDAVQLFNRPDPQRAFWDEMLFPK